MKYRIFDLVLVLILLVPSLVIIITTAGLVSLVDRHSPFFFSRRVGRCQNDFWIIKIKTMAGRPPIAAKSHEMRHYVTPLGHILRKFSLDEVPQIFNILSGSMSVVGPRPCLATELQLVMLREKYGIFSIRPGLTGLSQIRGRDHLSTRSKIAYEKVYQSKMSLRLNLYILCKTVKTVLFGHSVSY